MAIILDHRNYVHALLTELDRLIASAAEFAATDNPDTTPATACERSLSQHFEDCQDPSCSVIVRRLFPKSTSTNSRIKLPASICLCEICSSQSIDCSWNSGIITKLKELISLLESQIRKGLITAISEVSLLFILFISYVYDAYICLQDLRDAYGT